MTQIEYKAEDFREPKTEAFIEELVQFMFRYVKPHPRYKIPSITARSLDVLARKVYKYSEDIKNDK